jgi:hypothetical protein
MTKQNVFICTYCGIDPTKDDCQHSKVCSEKRKVRGAVLSNEPDAYDVFKNARSRNAALDTKAYTVYSGCDKKSGELVYIGTTIQKPKDRFRWHKHNGKDLRFEILAQFNSEQEMLNLEFELIKKHNPKLNKIKHRKQNLNVRLTDDVLSSRVGDNQWCQCCLKRRVNPGYSKCYYC